MEILFHFLDELAARRVVSICKPHQRSCLHTGLDIVETKHSPNGLKGRGEHKHPGISDKIQLCCWALDERSKAFG